MNTRSKNGKRSQRLRRDGGPLAEMEYPAIVSEDLWNAANSVSLCVTAVRETKIAYLLRGGMVRCAEHDHVMTGAESGKGYARYRCQQLRGAQHAEKRIHSVSGAKLEEAVWDAFLAFLADPERGRRGVDEMLAQREREGAVLDAERATLESKHAALEARADKLLDLYTGSKVTRERLDAKMAEYEAATRDVDAQIKRVDARRALVSVDIPSAQEVAEACRLLSKGAYYADAAGKRELLDAVQLRVYVDGDTWWADGVVPGLRLEGRIERSRWVHDTNARNCVSDVHPFGFRLEGRIARRGRGRKVAELLAV